MHVNKALLALAMGLAMAHAAKQKAEQTPEPDGDKPSAPEATASSQEPDHG